MTSQKQKKQPNYRSKFEETVGTFLGNKAIHEPEKLYFIEPSKKRFYVPDFKTKAGTYIETKGRWVASDRFKHLLIREQYPNIRFIIIFQNSNIKISKRSKTSYGEWATKHNLEWYDWNNKIPQEIFK